MERGEVLHPKSEDYVNHEGSLLCGVSALVPFRVALAEVALSVAPLRKAAPVRTSLAAFRSVKRCSCMNSSCL